jgi:fatty acid desaturase
MNTGSILQSDSRAVEWPTLLVFVATYAVWAIATTLIWDLSPTLAILTAALAIAQYSSLSHEVLHGHPFPSRRLSEALVFPGLTVYVPYLRFKDLHLQHHFDPALTDPYDDPESNYVDPAVWARLSAPARALLRFNNTLAGRMLLGPAISTWALVRGDVRVTGGWRWPGRCICRVWRWSRCGFSPSARCRSGPICLRPTSAGAS